MPRVKLSLEIPDSTWIKGLVQEYPDCVVHIISILSSDGSGHAVIEIDTDQPEDVYDWLEAESRVSQVDLLSMSDTHAIMQIESAETTLLDPLTSAGVPLKTPIQLTDGTAFWEFTTSQERLSSLRSMLFDAETDFQVEYVGLTEKGKRLSEEIFTDRQGEVFEQAYEMGYFEIPRAATVEEIADQLDVSKSTANDILRRAIRNMAAWIATEVEAKN